MTTRKGKVMTTRKGKVMTKKTLKSVPAPEVKEEGITFASLALGQVFRYKHKIPEYPFEREGIYKKINQLPNMGIAMDMTTMTGFGVEFLLDAIVDPNL